VARPTIYDRPLTKAERQRRWRHRRRRGRHLEPLRADPHGVTGRIDDLAAAAADGACFGTIYADPPWPWRDDGRRGASSHHYASMTLDALAALPVADLARADAHLHLWTTAAHVEAAADLMRAWGFRYASQFVWAKPGPGVGAYWRMAHELLLTGVRPNSPTFASGDTPSWGVFRRGRHSEKPQEVRTLIERASPAPRLELFARQVAPGWCAWGEDVGSVPGAEDGSAGA